MKNFGFKHVIRGKYQTLCCKSFLLKNSLLPQKLVFFLKESIGETFGLLVMGGDYSYIAVKKTNKRLEIFQSVCQNARDKTLENTIESASLNINIFYIRVVVNQDAIYNFEYSTSGYDFNKLRKSFNAKQGKWIGAKVGLFCIRKVKTNDSEYADIDWFRIE